MGKPKKHQSADAAAGEVNLETKDERELVSIATVKQSMLKRSSTPLYLLSMQESISWQIQSRLLKQALNLHKRITNNKKETEFLKTSRAELPLTKTDAVTTEARKKTLWRKKANPDLFASRANKIVISALFACAFLRNNIYDN